MIARQVKAYTQSTTRTINVFSPVKAFKYIGNIMRWNTNASIAHPEVSFIWLGLLNAQSDLNGVILLAVFQGIAYLYA